MENIKLKIIVFLTVVLYIVALSMTIVKLVNWQNEYNNKDEQMKILKQSLNEQLEEKLNIYEEDYDRFCLEDSLRQVQ